MATKKEAPRAKAAETNDEPKAVEKPSIAVPAMTPDQAMVHAALNAGVEA